MPAQIAERAAWLGMAAGGDGPVERRATTLHCCMRARTPAVEPFCHHLLVVDLPALPPERRAATVGFAASRARTLPTPMRIGVGLVAGVVGTAGAVAGPGPVARLLARRPLPVVGDYVRLLRSLCFAYVWETWPDTAADGAPSPRP
jgi:hypothetical protein